MRKGVGENQQTELFFRVNMADVKGCQEVVVCVYVFVHAWLRTLPFKDTHIFVKPS